MKKQVYLLVTLFLIVSFSAFAQTKEESVQDVIKAKKHDYTVFKALKIGNLQSTEIAEKGEFQLYLSHRFGSIKNGWSTFYGLDNAHMKIQFLYGIFNNVQIGISRESVRRTLAGSAKVRILNQKTGFPFNVTGYATININTALEKERYPNMKFPDRLSFAYQILVSRRFGKRFQASIAPTFIRQNLVLEPFQDHNQYAFGAGTRFKLTKSISLNVDYVYNFSRAEASIYQNPFTIGIDIETGGHVFQLLFSNAQSTNEPGFISTAEGNWGKGDVFFGFNTLRVF